MRFCGKCGAPVEDGFKFCKSCGAKIARPGEPAENAPDYTSVSYEKPPRKNRRGLWIGLLCAAVVLLSVALLFATGIVSDLFLSPEKKFVALQKTAVEDALDYMVEAAEGEHSGKISAVDTTLTVTASTNIDEEVSDILRKLTLVLDLDLQPEEQSIIEFALNYTGTDALTGTLTAEEGEIGFYLPELLDRNYYVIDPEEIAGVIPGAAGRATDTVEMFSDLSEEDIKDWYQQYLDVIFGIANKDNVEKSKETVELPGLDEEVECTVLTCRPAEEDYSDVLHTLQKLLKKDRIVQDLIRAYAQATYSGYGWYYGSADAYANDLMNEFYDGIADLDSDEMIARLEDLDLEWSIAYRGKRIYQIRVYSNKDDEGVAYESYGRLTEERADALVYYDGSAVPETAIRNRMSFTKGALSGKLYIEELGEVSYDLKLREITDLGLPGGEVELQIEGGTKISLEVEKNKKGSTCTIRAENTYYGEYVEIEAESSGKASGAEIPGAPRKELDSRGLAGLGEMLYENLEELLYEYGLY